MKHPIKDISSKVLAWRKRSLPLSVYTLHLDVCSFDITDPSSVLRNPATLASSMSFPLLGSAGTSFANTG